VRAGFVFLIVPLLFRSTSFVLAPSLSFLCRSVPAIHPVPSVKGGSRLFTICKRGEDLLSFDERHL